MSLKPVKKMGSSNSHKLKTEKSNKIMKHRQLRKIANLLRYVEMCVVLVLISRASFQHLPVALKISSEYFSGFMVSPRFVFLIGNVIIIALFAQSGQFSGKTTPEPDFYLEFLQNSTVNQEIQDDQKRVSMKSENGVKDHHHRIDGGMIKTKHPEKQSTRTTTTGLEVVKVKDQQIQDVQKKVSIITENSVKVHQRIDGSLIKSKHPKKQSTNGSMIKRPEKQSTRTATTGWEIVKVKDHQIQDDLRTENGVKDHPSTDGSMIKVKHPEKQSTDGSMIKLPEKQSTRATTTGLEIVEVKDYRRCQSEITRRMQSDEKDRRVLQRCETENRMRRSNEGETGRVGRSSYPEDGMSNDDFRRTVEAFIARQQRLREHELQAFSS